MNKHYHLLSRYENKRIVEIASYKGVSDMVIDTIYKGFDGLIKHCNEIQNDIYLELFFLDDNSTQMFAIMFPEDCPYEDETVKVFFVTQLATVTGLFYTVKEKH